MTAASPTLYFDVGSPYAYLSVERAESVLGRAPELEPVLLGAIFQWRGWGSWALTHERPARVAEVEERARRLGLPPVVWPRGWPVNGLAAMRAATWAKQQGRVEPFATAIFRRQFVDGADITDLGVVGECAVHADLDPRALMTAIQSQEVKQEPKRTTAQAWAVGVRGVPSLRVGGVIFYGDDKLEDAAAHLVK